MQTNLFASVVKIFTTGLLFIGAAGSSSVISLTEDNFDELTAGKTVFLKFFAPWCGHCKKMAPDWERLAKDWKNHPIGLVAEVDCTSDEVGDLCERQGIPGFPTLLYGDASALEPYSGGRSYEELSEFAQEHISKPVCSIHNLDVCDDKTKMDIERLSKLSLDELSKMKEEVESTLSSLEETFEAKVDELEEQFMKLEEAHGEMVEKVKKDANYGILRQILTAKGTEDEL